MDRALKERVIGAIVLVVFAILIVPVFLDGPSNHAENVQESISLPGQDAQSAKQKTVVLERDREQPVPALRDQTTGDEAGSTSAEKQVAPQAADPEMPAANQPSPSPGPTLASAHESTRQSTQKSATGMWAVQLGSFSNQANAERLAADLRKEGYAAFLSQLKSGSKYLHRVRIGPQKDRASAESVASGMDIIGRQA